MNYETNTHNEWLASMLVNSSDWLFSATAPTGCELQELEMQHTSWLPSVQYALGWGSNSQDWSDSAAALQVCELQE